MAGRQMMQQSYQAEGEAGRRLVESGPVRVHVISVGGTIAMQEDADGRVYPQLQPDDLANSMRAHAGGLVITSSAFKQVPSASLSFDDVYALADDIAKALREGAVGVVVTQGTDTLEETAFAIDLLHQGPQPIICTGAMRYAGSPGADGDANLLASLQVAASADATHWGALVVMDEQIHAADRVHKARAVGVGAFRSPGFGPVGWVTEGTVRVPYAKKRSRPHGQLVLTRRPIHAVGLIRLGLGDDGRLLQAVRSCDYDALVIEAFGAGHVPDWMVDSLTSLAREIPVVLTSRTGSGRVLSDTYHFAGSESDLLNCGLLSGGGLDGIKARVLVQVLLDCGIDAGSLAEHLSFY